MMDTLCLDGSEIAKTIKRRCRAVGKTVKQICFEARVKYRTYKSWRTENVNPSIANLKKLDAVLKRYEAEKVVN